MSTTFDDAWIKRTQKLSGYNLTISKYFIKRACLKHLNILAYDFMNIKLWLS